MKKNIIELSIHSFGLLMIFQITELDKTYEIILKILDKIIDNESYNDQLDKLFEEISKYRELKKEEKIKELAQQLNELNEKHLKYSIFNIELTKNANPEYERLFNLANNYKTESSKEQERLRTKAILDGKTVSLKNKSNFYRITAPTIDSHPVLMNFLHQTRNFLEKQYPMAFQSKRIIHF